MSEQKDGGIPWCTTTWNPLRGCRRVSPGCVNCYAEGVAARFSGPGLAYEGLARKTEAGESRWTGVFKEIDDRLLDPLRWTRSRLIFVNSMSDVFGEGVSDAYIDKIFAVALACHVFQGAERRRGSFRPGRHVFQFLTKRAKRQREYFLARSPVEHLKAWAEAGDHLFRMSNPDLLFSEYVASQAIHIPGDGGLWSAPDLLFPLPDVWLGVSIESGDYLHRADELSATPAAVRWVSQEPQIDDVDWTNRLRGPEGQRLIDWIVVGGESGKNARRFEAKWARRTIRQCRAAGVAIFMKQLGAKAYDEENYVAGADLVYDEHDLPQVRRLKHHKGGDPAEWPEDLRVREYPR